MEEIVAAGAGVALFGVGEPSQARAFRAKAGWTGPIVVDAKGEAYAAAGIGKIGCLALLRPSLWLASIRSRKEGFQQTKVQGDPWQLGGTLVVAPGYRLIYAYLNASPQDEAPLDAVVEAARSASAVR